MRQIGILAAAAAVVSWDAQYVMVRSVKHAAAVAALEAGRFDAQGHEFDRGIQREAVERLVRGLEGGGDAVLPFDGDLAALAVVAQQRHAVEPAVGEAWLLWPLWLFWLF